MKFAGMYMPSLIDFPQKVSAVLFTSGCNLACPYCHNWELASGTLPDISILKVCAKIINRLDFIDGLVITGGEPTIYNDLPRFLKYAKEAFGIAIKLDTNGMRPDILVKCFPYLDYIALDIKTSLDRYEILGKEMPDELLDSICIIKKSGIPYEFRCTAVPILLNEDNIEDIAKLAEGAERFVIQQFNPERVADECWKLLKPYTRKELLKFAEYLKDGHNIKNVSVRWSM